MVLSQETLVAGSLPPNSPGITERTAREETTSDLNLPPVTVGSSEHYIERLARANSRASASTPLSILFQSEKLKPPETIESIGQEGLRQILYDSSIARLTTKMSNGAFITEAGDFAAAACWELEDIHEGPRQDMNPDFVRTTRPIFTEFVENVETVKKAQLLPIAASMSQGRFWHLAMMARDPGVPYVKGAVRAILVPFMEKFTSEHQEGGPIPIWLEAGTEQAKSVYAHYGFREVGAWEVRGVKTWAMIYTGKPESSLPETMADLKN